MLVFVDESGCPGLKLESGSTPHFGLTLVIFEDHREAGSTENTIKKARSSLHLSEDYEFRFSRSSPRIKKAFLQAVARHRFHYFSIVINKANLRGKGFRYPWAFYKFAVGLVFQNAAFLLEDATVIFDGSGSRRFRRELKTYVRKTVTQKTGRQGLIKEVQMQDSKRSNLVQLADMICGAITHSYKKRARDPRCYQSMISGRERQVQFWPTKDSPNPSL